MKRKGWRGGEGRGEQWGIGAIFRGNHFCKKENDAVT